MVKIRMSVGWKVGFLIALAQLFKSKVKGGGKGHIVIEFGSLDILDGIVARLKVKD